MNENIADTDVQYEEKPRAPGSLNFLSYTPCIFKNTFKDGLDRALRSYRMETGNSFNSYGPIEGCHNCADDPYDGLWNAKNIDSFPDALATKGFGDFFRKEFVERFIMKGCFRNVWEGPVNNLFSNAGLVDPNGWFTVYSAIPFVILVDRRKLGGLPVPKRWSDLFEPHYRDNIIFAGSGDRLADTPLLYLYLEHGEEGFKKLAHNIRSVRSGAEIAKEAGSTNTSGAAVYVLSWFFAKSCTKTDVVSVIWPEDGAVVSPVYMLVKSGRVKEAAPAINYVLSPEFGNESAQSCLPVINPQVDNNLPEGASFKWLGWDYVMSHDMFELTEHAQGSFFSVWDKAPAKVIG